jgi:broad specificity phosphatase PhoE
MGNYEDHLQFFADWKRSSQERDWQAPDGESARESGNRMDRVLRSLPESGLPYIVVAHGGIISDLLKNQFPLGEFDIRFKHCSITTLVLDGQTYSIEGVASTSHLERVGIGEGRPIGERR